MMRWGLEGFELEAVANFLFVAKREAGKAGRALAASVTAEARRKSLRSRNELLERIGVLG